MKKSDTTTPIEVSTKTSSSQRKVSDWENDELLGDQATNSMILYANQNHPELKSQYPVWKDRIQQIEKIWKKIPYDKQFPYINQASENIIRKNKNINVPKSEVFLINEKI